MERKPATKIAELLQKWYNWTTNTEMQLGGIKEACVVSQVGRGRVCSMRISGCCLHIEEVVWDTASICQPSLDWQVPSLTSRQCPSPVFLAFLTSQNQQFPSKQNRHKYFLRHFKILGGNNNRMGITLENPDMDANLSLRPHPSGSEAALQEPIPLG